MPAIRGLMDQRFFGGASQAKGPDHGLVCPICAASCRPPKKALAPFHCRLFALYSIAIRPGGMCGKAVFIPPKFAPVSDAADPHPATASLPADAKLKPLMLLPAFSASFDLGADAVAASARTAKPEASKPAQPHQ